MCCQSSVWLGKGPLETKLKWLPVSFSHQRLEIILWVLSCTILLLKTSQEKLPPHHCSERSSESVLFISNTNAKLSQSVVSGGKNNNSWNFPVLIGLGNGLKTVSCICIFYISYIVSIFLNYQWLKYWERQSKVQVYYFTVNNDNLLSLIVIYCNILLFWTLC